MARFNREFYLDNTVAVAQRLLGTYLIRRLPSGEILAGRITETEAYIGRCDKACHAYQYKKTPRTAAMFASGGHVYIYFIYGMHYCLNLVTEPEGEPAAVLIRSLEPAAGEETMRRLRFGEKATTTYQKKNFLNGPGKVCKALSLTIDENGLDLTGDTLFVCQDLSDIGLSCPPPPRQQMRCGPRIGVDYAQEARDYPWRFWLEKEE